MQTNNIHPNLKPSDLEIAIDVAGHSTSGRREVAAYAFSLLLMAGNGGEAGRAAFDAIAAAHVADAKAERARAARLLATARATSRRAAARDR